MHQPVSVLMVEDNPGDQQLILQGFKKSKFSVDPHIVDNGELALQFLRKQGKFVDSPTPDLILLDLNLPKLDGRQVLEEIRKDSTLAEIPVVIFTSSTARPDVVKAYRLGANSYLTKPNDLAAYLNVIKGIAQFWFRLAVVPGCTKLL